MIRATETSTAAASQLVPAVPDRLEQFRQSMRRYEALNARLPLATLASCPLCRAVGPATFDKLGRQIVLTHNCPACGQTREVHHDAIWTKQTSDQPASPACTLGGAPIQPVLRRLPRTVETLCPECCAVLVGRYFVEAGQVFIEKACPEHGHFRDRINSDVTLYSKGAWWSFEEHAGQRRPRRSDARRCPSDCGLCSQHQSGSCLAQIDLTNRCNMRCPVCFANAGVTGYVHEPGYDQVLAQLRALREMSPTPATAVQFTGGEPTIHPDFFRVLAATRELGFSHIQMATNGIRMADFAFAQQSAEAGLHTLYLQFDGVGEEPHRLTRNYPGIWEKKLACMENCRKLDLKICLVPTILRGVNDGQVGDILHFACRNIDTISGISYQPVSFSGRIDPAELAARRYTLGDLARDIAQASGAVPLRDMYPLSIVAPLGQFLQALTGQEKIRPSCHPDCAFGTYFLVAPDGKPFPFPAVIDVEGMFSDMNAFARRLAGREGKLNFWDKLWVLRMFKRHFRSEAAPPGLDVQRFMTSLRGLVDKHHGRGTGEQSTYKTLLCAGMHFQDRYNYDVQRAKRCVILYSTPEGIFPFCTWNCGPEYRHLCEQRHALPAGELRPESRVPFQEGERHEVR